MARQLEATQAQLAMLANRTGFTPAALLFQHPMMLERRPEDAEPGKTEDKSRKAAPRMAPSAALPKAEKPEPSGKASVGLPQTSKEQIKPEAPKPTPRLSKETTGRAERISAKNEPRRGPAAREVGSPPSARALFLPPTLKPIDEEWEFQ